MVGSREVRESIVKSQRRDKTPRSENHEVVSTLAERSGAMLWKDEDLGYLQRALSSESIQVLCT